MDSLDSSKIPIAIDFDRDKVKRAVKEALDDRTLQDMGKDVANLSTQITDGFKGIHERQDTTNGRIGTVEKRVDKLEGRGVYEKLIWFLLTTLVGIVVFFITRGS